MSTDERVKELEAELIYWRDKFYSEAKKVEELKARIAHYQMVTERFKVAIYEEYPQRIAEGIIKHALSALGEAKP